MAANNANKNLIIVVLIAAVAILGFVLYQNQQHDNEIKMTMPGNKEFRLELPKN